MSQQQSQSSGRKRLALSPKRILVLVLGVLALIFGFQNADEARVQFFGWELSAPGWVWLLGMFAVGFLVGSAFPWFRRKG
jgi:uncharacterized integral membrane protein